MRTEFTRRKTDDIHHICEGLAETFGLIFENRDAEEVEHMFGSVIADKEEGPRLLCFWIDEKIHRNPNLTRTAQVYQEYADPYHDTLSVLRVFRSSFTTSEPVAAMISRSLKRTGATLVEIYAPQVTESAWLGLQEDLADEKVESIHLEFMNTASEVGLIEPDGKLGLIGQIPRAFFMPKLIAKRVFPNGPSDDEKSSSDLVL